MKNLVTIIYPPQHNPEMPHIAPAILKAKLNQKGISNRIIDANIEFYHYALSKPTQATLYPKNSALDSEDKFNEIKESSITLRSPLKKEDSTKYLKARIILDNALTEFAKKYGGNFGFGYSNFTYDCRNSKEVIKALKDKTKNPYIEFFEKNIEKYVSGNILGISIGISEQLIPAFTLAKLAKEKNPNITIILGGNTFSRIKSELESSGLNKYYDYGISKEGEEKLVKLVQDIQYKKSRKEIKNNLESDELTCPDILNEPTPDFSDYPFSQKGEPNTYFSSELAIPIMGARGCYHNKCSFCAIPKMYANNGKGRMKEAKQVFEDSKKYFETFGVTNFKFVEESIMPKIAKKYTELVLGSKLPLKAEAYASLENWIKNPESKDIGKVFSSFWVGYETCAKESRENINKSGAKEGAKVDQIIERLYDLKITPNIFLMAGIPGETKKDLNYTRKHVEKNNHIGATFLSIYEISKHSQDSINKELHKKNKFENIQLAGDLSVSLEYIGKNGKNIMERNKKWAKNFYDSLFRTNPNFLINKAFPFMTLFALASRYGPDITREIRNKENIKLADQITMKMWYHANLNRRA